ncbi:hypothetical protein HMPREF0043_02240, partial [Actinobaculum sp. oral taxon 183 str. F0552]
MAGDAIGVVLAQAGEPASGFRVEVSGRHRFGDHGVASLRAASPVSVASVSLITIPTTAAVSPVVAVSAVVAVVAAVVVVATAA